MSEVDVYESISAIAFVLQQHPFQQRVLLQVESCLEVAKEEE